MKRCLCALIALMLLTCAALAEADTTAAQSIHKANTPQPTEEAEDAPDVGEAPEESAAPEESDAPAGTQAPAAVRTGFEDGFALELPEDWLYHAVTEEMAENGVVYCLSNAEGTGWLYVQNWFTDCADLDELKELIDRTARLQSSGIYSFNGTEFVVYDLKEGDVSCCAALVDGRALNLVFTPQSDAGFMAVAAQILNTFEIL